MELRTWTSGMGLRTLDFGYFGLRWVTGVWAWYKPFFGLRTFKIQILGLLIHAQDFRLLASDFGIRLWIRAFDFQASDFETSGTKSRKAA